MAELVGIATSRGADTERGIKGTEHLTREDRMRLAQIPKDSEKEVGKQRPILDLTSQSTTGSSEAAHDEEWGECTVIQRKPWVDCACGNPVENEGDRLCEVCKILGDRGMEIRRGNRRNEEGEGGGDFYSEALNVHEWYHSERNERRARERGAEPSDGHNDRQQLAVARRAEAYAQPKDKLKGRGDVSGEKERDLCDIPSNFVGEDESTLLRAAAKLPERIMTTREFRFSSIRPVARGIAKSRETRSGQSSGFGTGSAASDRQHYSQIAHMESATSRENDAQQRKTGFGQSSASSGKAYSPGTRGAGVLHIMDQDLGIRGHKTSNSGKSSQRPERLGLTDRLGTAKVKWEREIAAEQIEPLPPRPLASFPPSTGVAESQEVSVYQAAGGERGNDRDKYEMWRAKDEKVQQEKDRQKFATLEGRSRYASSFTPRRQTRQAETAVVSWIKLASHQSLDASIEDGGARRGRWETAMNPMATKAKDETERPKSLSRGRPGSPATRISREEAFDEVWKQLCDTNGLNSKDDELKNLHQNRLGNISNRLMRRFMWCDWRPWPEDEEASPQAARRPHEYRIHSYYPTPDATPEGRGVWDGRTMHSGTTWQNAVWFIRKTRWDQGCPFGIFVPRRKKYGPSCKRCLNGKLDCDGMQPKCCYCKRLDCDCIAFIRRRTCSIDRMKVERAGERVAKAAEELDIYRLSNLDKDRFDDKEAALLQAQDSAKGGLKQLGASVREPEENLKNRNGERRSGCEHQTAETGSHSCFHDGGHREHDNDLAIGSFIFHEIEQAAVQDQDITRNPDREDFLEEQIRGEKLLDARKEVAAAAGKYESYRLTVWGQEGTDRKEVNLRQEAEMAEALLERLEGKEKRSMLEQEVGNEDQPVGRVYHRGSAQSRDLPIYARDSETRNAESREAALRREYEANRQRGSAPSREPETRRRFEEERDRQQRAYRLEEVAKMKVLKQRQQEQGSSIGKEHVAENNDSSRSRSTISATLAEKMAVGGTNKAMSMSDHALTVEDEDELEAGLDGLVLRTKVQVPESMRRAMEKDEEWRSFA